MSASKFAHVPCSVICATVGGSERTPAMVVRNEIHAHRIVRGIALSVPDQVIPEIEKDAAFAIRPGTGTARPVKCKQVVMKRYCAVASNQRTVPMRALVMGTLVQALADDTPLHGYICDPCARNGQNFVVPPTGRAVIQNYVVGRGYRQRICGPRFAFLCEPFAN